MKRILSTKKLSLAQKELLLNSGLSFVEYDAIEIIPLEFEVPDNIDNAIFTSGNAVDIFFGRKADSVDIGKVYCVGSKTAQKLADFGQNVVKIFDYGSELGDFIKKTHKNEDFYFFCGNLRRDDIPEKVNLSKNRLFEIKTYKTELKTRKFDQNFDGILFFSPSGVSSFTAENSIGNSVAICIGDSTASEVKNYTSNIFIANQTTAESVIAKAVKILREND